MTQADHLASRRAGRLGACGALLAAATALVAGCSRGPQALAPANLPQVPAFSFESDVVFLATGGTNGMLELCDCPSSMTGGLSRRSGMVQSYRRSFDDVCLVDLGNAMHYDPQALQNRYLPEAYSLIGYDVLVPGNHEWALGPEVLAERITPDRPALLATGVTLGDPPGDLHLRSRLDMEPGGRGGLTLLSALSPDALHFLPAQVRSRIKATDKENLIKRIRSLRRSGRSVVVLVHGPIGYAREIAQEAQPDLILRGQGDEPRGKIESAFSVPIVTVGGSQVVSAVAVEIQADGRLRPELRLEVVDQRWPIDPRMRRIFKNYVGAVRSGAASSSPAGS